VLPRSITFFPAALRARFDIISWDPRGAGANEVQCFASAEDQDKFFAGFPMGFPVSEAEQRTWIRGYVRYGQLCAERNGDLLAHVSTVDTANDLDLLRQAVGESQLNYWGLSYGSFLGALYANLFPDKLRALVLDGNVDPVPLTNGGNNTAFLPSVLRFGSDKGTAKTLDAFLTLCGQASTAHCAFSAGSAAATKTKWAALLRRLHEHPINVDSPPRTYTYAGLITLIASDVGVIAIKALWPQAAELLQSLWTSGEQGDPSPAPVLQPLGPVPPSGPYNTIRCGEVPTPRNTDLYPAFAALAYARSGDVGPAWVWRWDETCASWPVTAAHRYGGPWNRPTANPILVINNTYDSETPYEDAIAMVKRLARARLLTVDGYGHTVLINPSTCANDYVSRYFIDGTLPPEGTVCRQDQPPFATGP
jgi:pimeloyl-ACP methyl ester carboxylesterase